MNSKRISTAACIFLLVSAFWSCPFCSGEDGVKWVEKRFEHKENARAGGGEVRWRDIVTLDKYYLYDFTIHVHSVRGGGSEFANNAVNAGAKAVAGALGVPAPDVDVNKLINSDSGGPAIIVANENTLLMKGVTSYGTALFDSGGNVEYTVVAAFIMADDISKVPGRFGVASVHGSKASRELDEKRITHNLGIDIDFVRTFVKSRRDEARRIGTLPKNDLKREIESMKKAQLSATIDWLDRGTLKTSLEIIDRSTLKAALEEMDLATLREGMIYVDGDTLTEILKRLEPERRKAVLPKLDDATRKEVEKRRRFWKT